MERFNSTDNIGVSILKLRFLKDTGWIPRSVVESDMGIDANVEQVINRNPTAHYISIQLKTGFGNVHTDKKKNYTFYFDNVHYEYWMSSQIPVILALCDPDKEIIYWELIKKYNISKTNNGYKITIFNNHILDKSSIEELTTIIDSYQTDFELPEIYEEDIIDPDYWTDLLYNCSEALLNSTTIFNQLDDKYKSNNKKMSSFLQFHTEGIDKSIANEAIRKHARILKLAIDVCKTQFKSQIPIIIKTHIESIRLIERTLENSKVTLSNRISLMLQTELTKEVDTIESSTNTFSKGVEIYKKSNQVSADLQRSELSFANVLNDYVSELKELSWCIKALITKLDKKINMFSDQ